MKQRVCVVHRHAHPECFQKTCLESKYWSRGTVYVDLHMKSNKVKHLCKFIHNIQLYKWKSPKRSLQQTPLFSSIVYQCTWGSHMILKCKLCHQTNTDSGNTKWTSLHLCQSFHYVKGVYISSISMYTCHILDQIGGRHFCTRKPLVAALDSHCEALGFSLLI